MTAVGPEYAFDVRVTPRVRLLDTDLAVVDDLTARVIAAGSHVGYQHDARSPHNASIALTGPALNWGQARVAVAMTIRDQITGAETTDDLGVYVVGSASRGSARPDEWRVELHDLTMPLDQASGVSWSITRNETVQQAVARVVAAAETPVNVIDDLPGERIPAARVWPITDSATWLDVLTHVAESAGGRVPYMTRTGDVVLSRYVRLDDLSDTLRLDERSATLLEPGMMVDTDLFATPNEVVVIADVTNLSGTVARTVERRRNYDHGPTSRSNRGWWQRSVFTVDAVSADDLRVHADRIWDDTQYHGRVVTASLTPTTRLWAHDVVALDAPSVGVNDERAFVRAWRLPLDGAPIQIVLGVL